MFEKSRICNIKKQREYTLYTTLGFASLSLCSFFFAVKSFKVDYLPKYPKFI